ncbi:MAG: aminotransferase class IV [Planctomycetia bacterium]|nr:aminotransferase class IV [Planctomycetia bacterium]
MESLACLDGELMPVDEAKVPVWDRGFSFGDAVYEMFRLYQGCCWLEDEHMARLRRSLAEMSYPSVDFEALTARIHRTISLSGVQEGTLYLQITRGVAPRLHAFPDPPVSPTELILVRSYDDGPTAELREKGVGVISHPDLRWKRCDVKSTNLLANVLANEAAHRAGCYEAVMVGDDGLVTEATHSSVLWVRGGRVEGTPDGPGILPGTTRGLLTRLAAEIGLTFRESRVTLGEMVAAEEVMLLGTTIEVLPVVGVDGRAVSGGTPGPVARRLQRAFREAVGRWLAPEMA